MFSSKLEPGTEVVTFGGLHGKVNAVEDKTVLIEISPNVIVRVNANQISKANSFDRRIIASAIFVFTATVIWFMTEPSTVRKFSGDKKPRPPYVRDSCVEMETGKKLEFLDKTLTEHSDSNVAAFSSIQEKISALQRQVQELQEKTKQ